VTEAKDTDVKIEMKYSKVYEREYFDEFLIPVRNPTHLFRGSRNTK